MSLTYQLNLNRESIKFLAKQERIIQERIRRALIGLKVRIELYLKLTKWSKWYMY